MRAHADGNETVPTVAIGDTVLVNPSAHRVVAVAADAGIAGEPGRASMVAALPTLTSGAGIDGARSRSGRQVEAGVGGGHAEHAAPTRADTTPRRRASTHTPAAASTANCHRWSRARANGTVDPAMAPIEAAPAPVRKPWAHALVRRRSNRGPPTRMKTNDGAKATKAASSPPAMPEAA